MRYFIIYFFFLIQLNAYSQEKKVGIGINLSFPSSLYGFYQLDKHHFGLGFSKASSIYEYSKNDIGFTQTSFSLTKGSLITGMMFHYRYFPYSENKIFDIFFEGNLSSTIINIYNNQEKSDPGFFIYSMVGIGFKAKFAKRFAITQTNLIGLQNIIAPLQITEFINSSPFQKKLRFGISIGLEFRLFKL